MMKDIIKEANREVKAKRRAKVFDAVAVWFMMFVICYVAFMVLRFIIQTNTTGIHLTYLVIYSIIDVQGMKSELLATR